MKQISPSRISWLALSALLLLIIGAVALVRWVPDVRGKTAALPLTDTLTAEQQLAQELALENANVQRYTAGQRSEVFGVHPILAEQYTAASSACATADCRQVEIYNFDANAAITAIVNVETKTVLDVLYLPQMHPGINKRLNDLALELVLKAPEVEQILGYQPQTADMAPVEANALETVCADGHLCAAPTFELDEHILWAVVDLTDERLVMLDWTNVAPTGSGAASTPEGCPAPGSIDRDGWTMNYAVTGSDGLRVYNIARNGIDVATSIKVAEWHADYGSVGYVDATGCTGSGGFPIFPYGDTQVLDLLDDNSQVVGFEVVQDFRMNNWGQNCNYRYEQHVRFYEDGRFRVVAGAYGRGCGVHALYRPLVRVDMAVNGAAEDTFGRWNGSEWENVTTEDYFVPYDETRHGPHSRDASGYSWRILDSSGLGYYLEQDIGQFDGSNDHPDEPFLYVTLHQPSEGDTDLGAIGNCCNDNHQQGPHNYLNGENVQSSDIVIWYVPQMQTEATSNGGYCWTFQGEPNPITYPCFAGPMFVPANANFAPDHASLTTVPTTFTPLLFAPLGSTYQWDFGDGITDTVATPSHQYTLTGTYTVTLTITNSLGSDTFAQTVDVHKLLLNPPGGEPVLLPQSEPVREDD